MQFFLVSFIGIFLDIVSFAIVARILMSWMNSPGAGRLKMFLYDVTEPILAPFRRPIFRIGVIDVSPIIVLILIDLSKSLLLYIVNYLFLTL